MGGGGMGLTVPQEWGIFTERHVFLTPNKTFPLIEEPYTTALVWPTPLVCRYEYR
jgi:hypothetical protein